MTWTRKTLTEIIQQIEDDIKLGVQLSGFGEVDFSFRRSVLKVLARAYAGAIHELYGKLQWILRQVFPDTAEGPYLDRWASIWGIVRKVAEKAAGSVSAECTSPVAISEGMKLSRTDGVAYVTTEALVLSPPGGSVNVEAETRGADGNCDAGSELTWTSPPAGLNPTATVDSGGISGGTDSETDEDLLIRLLARIKRPPHGGAGFDYVNWARENSGVTRAWCLPLVEGLGTVGLAFVQDEKETYPDLVRGGSFDEDSSLWSKDSNWSISGGVATSNGGSGDLVQDIDATPSRTYRLKFDWTRTSGTLTPKIGSAAGTAISSGTSGTFDEEIVAAGDGMLYFTSSSFDGTIDNVEVFDEVSKIIPSAETLDSVKAYIEDESYPPPDTGKRPVTAALTMIRLDAVKVDFTIELKKYTGDLDTVKANIQAQLEDLLYREGAPSMTTTPATLYLSHIREAISRAEGEIDHVLTSPSSDIVIQNDEILVMGTITWT